MTDKFFYVQIIEMKTGHLLKENGDDQYVDEHEYIKFESLQMAKDFIQLRKKPGIEYFVLDQDDKIVYEDS